jgi:hypothetical protein
MTTTIPLAALEAELRTRTPRKDAGRTVKQENIPVRTCYQAVVRLRGPRDDVLDYAAWLMTIEPGADSPCHGRLELAAIEQDTPDALVLVLSRDLYEA